VIDGGPLGNLGKPPPDPARLTTIAWRVGHLGFGMGGFASTRFGDGSVLTRSPEFPAHAAEIRSFLDGHYRPWRDGIASLDDEGWNAPLPAS
jgi:hypothetical protein